MTTALEYLQNGSTSGIIQGLLAPYTNLLGGWFYFILSLMVIVAVQFKTESIEATALTMLLLGSTGFAVNYFPPGGAVGNFSMYSMFILLMVMGLGILLYKMVKRRG